VYFLEAPIAKLVKIGHSTNLKWRLTGIQTQCPVQLELVGLVKAPTAAEFVFQRICRDAHSHGEWFHLTDKVVSLINAVGDHGGEQMTALQVIALAEKYDVPIFESQGMLARGGSWERALTDQESNRRAKRAIDSAR
jgi:hypothetical protein